MTTQWGVEAQYLFVTQASNRLAVILPGMGYTSQAPLLWFARRVAVAKGYDVLSVEYGFQAARADPKREDFETMLNEVRQGIRSEQVPQYQEVVLIGKSVGTSLIDPLAADLGVSRAIFLTPTRHALSGIQQLRSLVIVGDADPAFPPDLVEQAAAAQEVTLHLVPGANHSLEIPQDTDRPLEILRSVTRWCAEFL